MFSYTKEKECKNRPRELIFCPSVKLFAFVDKMQHHYASTWSGVKYDIRKDYNVLVHRRVVL